MVGQQPRWLKDDRHRYFGILASVRDFVDSFANSSPARLALLIFTAVILVFTGLLSLPVSSATHTVTPLHDEFFQKF